MVDLRSREQERPADKGPTSLRPYEAPRVTRLGTVAEMTLGSSHHHHTDGLFTGSEFD
jgi:hypothetical protein